MDNLPSRQRSASGKSVRRPIAVGLRRPCLASKARKRRLKNSAAGILSRIGGYMSSWLYIFREELRNCYVDCV